MNFTAIKNVFIFVLRAKGKMFLDQWDFFVALPRLATRKNNIAATKWAKKEKRTSSILYLIMVAWLEKYNVGRR